MTASAEITEIVANSLGQGTILTSLVFFSMKLIPALSAKVRYAIWWMVLAVVVSLPLEQLRSRDVVLQNTFQPTTHSSEHSGTGFTRYRHLQLPAANASSAVIRIGRSSSSDGPLWFITAWVLAAVWRFASLVFSFVKVRRIKHSGRPSEIVLPSIKRPVRLIVSGEITSPVALGFLRPTVVLPESLLDHLNDTDLQCVILHEIAHIARWDDWSNLLGSLIGALFAIHPIVQWLLVRLDLEREMACDEWAVKQIGSARRYAAALLRVCEVVIKQRPPVLACGSLGRSKIAGRIDTLLTTDCPALTSYWNSRGIAAVAILLLMLPIAFLPVDRWIVLAERPEFDVASVRLNTANGPSDNVPRRSGEHILMHNTRLYSMVFFAYHLDGDFQLIAKQQSPVWSHWYDVDAIAPAQATDDQIRLMFQSLLHDRFKLTLHTETRNIGAYRLVLAKGRRKLQPNDAQAFHEMGHSDSTMANAPPFEPQIDGKSIKVRIGYCGTLPGHDGLHLIGYGVTVSRLAQELMGPLGGAVVDQTGLTGAYNFAIVYEPLDIGAPSAEGARPIIEAVQADVGLRLEKGKVPVEVLVIDHAQQPSGN